MQRIALLIVITGMIFLASYIELSRPILIQSDKEILNLIQNQKVYVSGSVIKESQTTYYRILTLNNNITLNCECNNLPKLINKKIKVLGIIDAYQKNKVKVLRIKWQ